MEAELKGSQIEELARKLSYDIVVYAVEKKRGILHKSTDYYVKNMRLAVDYLLEKFQTEFLNIAIKFSRMESICESFMRSADSMFDDKEYNWWRVFALYACAACLADMCVDSRNGSNLVRKMGETLCDYTCDNLAPWISSQGGWVR